MLYMILKDEDPDELENEVQDFLDKGWKCQGGVCHHATPASAWYAQAVVKDNEQEDPY